MPMISTASKVLVQKFGKVSNIKIELAQGFTQLYKIDFVQNGKNKTIFSNGTLTNFIDGSALSFRSK